MSIPLDLPTYVKWLLTIWDLILMAPFIQTTQVIARRVSALSDAYTFSAYI